MAAGERDEEIRQMLEARNARRIRQGKEPLDMEAEMAALARPAIDPGLAGEVRDLVVARNARRARAGQGAARRRGRGGAAAARPHGRLVLH